MKSDPLFLLINSLNPEEKRQFKLFSSKYQRAKGNNYVRLFDAMDAMKEYDEDVLRQKFRKEKFIKQLHVTKNYLYHLILQSLTLTHIEHSPDAPLDGTLIQAEILFKKSLYDPCLRLVEKGKLLAKKMERPLLFLEFSALEQRIAIKKYDIDYFRKMSVSGYYDMVKTLDDIRDFVELRRLQNSLIVMMEKPFEMLGDEERVKLYEESHHPLLKDDRRASLTDCRILYFNYWRQFYDYTHDHEKAWEIAGRYVDFILGPENAQKTELFPSSMFALSNLVGSQIKTGRFEEASETLQRLMDVPARTSDQRLMKDERYHLWKHKLLLASGKTEEALALSAETEEFLKRYHEKISRRFRNDLISGLATLYFCCGLYSKALYWRNRIINTPEKEVQEDIYEYSLLADLLIHLELKSHQLLQYKLKSVNRYFRKKKQYHAIEMAVIRTISLCLRKEGSSLDKALEQAEEEFGRLEKQKINTPYFEKFDFLSWVRSKRSRVPMSGIRHDHERENP